MKIKKKNNNLNNNGYFDLMSYRRSHKSQGETAFINKFLLPKLKRYGKVETDEEKNVILKMGETSVCFSSHIDTMHNRLEQTHKQKLKIDENLNQLFSDGRQCLGADDGTGIYLMLCLLEAGIPGLYIFHRGEERGGIGSRHIASTAGRTGLFEGIQQAVAFDRAYTSHVITHQMGRRCASRIYARALAKELNKEMPATSMVSSPWAPNDGGSFTDTANYTSLIPECTNLSIGYYHQHSAREYQSLNHLNEMSEAITKINWEELPISRDPTVVESRFTGRPGNFSLHKQAQQVPIDFNEEIYIVEPIDPEYIRKNAESIAMWFEDNDLDTYDLASELMQYEHL